MTQTTTKSLNVLRVDASVRRNDSITRTLTDRFIGGLKAEGDVTIRNHDLANGLPLLDEEWVGANFTPEADRTDEQKQKLKLSDDLITDVKAADILVIGVPIYNFSIPTALKAWIDLITRAGVSFQYTEEGPEGLIKGKKAYLLVASGGTPVGSDYDYAARYMRHILSFIGIEDVTIIAADQMAVDAEASLAKAGKEIDDLLTTSELAA